MRNFPNARCDDSFDEKKDTTKGNGGKEQLKRLETALNSQTGQKA